MVTCEEIREFARRELAVMHAAFHPEPVDFVREFVRFVREMKWFTIARFRIEMGRLHVLRDAPLDVVIAMAFCDSDENDDIQEVKTAAHHEAIVRLQTVENRLDAMMRELERDIAE